MKIGFDKLKIAGLGLTAIGGLAALAGGFIESAKNEAQIDEAVQKRVSEFFAARDNSVYLESSEENEEMEEES